MEERKIHNPVFAERTECFANVHAEEIRDAFESNLGLTEMFRGYLQSDLFAKLAPDQKSKAFDIYSGLYDYLESLHSEMYQHDIFS